jgi:hypothetical protein
MKRNDACLDFDLIEHFWTRLGELASNLQIDKMALTECFKDEYTRKQFLNLVNGISPKFEEIKKQKLAQD